MLEMVKGCQVPFPEKLGEGYKMEERMITANVGAGKLRQAVENFIAMHASERLFFILEIPTNQKEEPEPEKVLHKDVYYLDGCSRKKALGILEDYGELLIQDGMSAFGFGCQETGDEIMVEKYNILPSGAAAVWRSTGLFLKSWILGRGKSWSPPGTPLSSSTPAEPGFTPWKGKVSTTSRRL